MSLFADFYRGRTVLITGHTGFKGSWLSVWLSHLGARVVGLALEPPTQPNNFDACRLGERMTHLIGDIRDRSLVARTIDTYQPSLIFHLAAQPIVRVAFADPIGTFDVNVMGTVNVLGEAMRRPFIEGVVTITSDKAYRNKGWVWGYRETDELGGYDPYSASKAAAEMAIGCFQDARFQGAVRPGAPLPIAAARAGNVIGGGDWAADRIIPDVVRAIQAQRDVVLRHPQATRPWQHVLEPLSGYLWLGYKLVTGDASFASCWNFGPREANCWTVHDVVAGLLHRWRPEHTGVRIEPDTSGAESTLLRLDCVKSLELLHWHAVLDVSTTLDRIVSWYRLFYRDPNGDMYDTVVADIADYVQRARDAGLEWARE